jgi:hypothetical protein
MLVKFDALLVENGVIIGASSKRITYSFAIPCVSKRVNKVNHPPARRRQVSSFSKPRPVVFATHLPDSLKSPWCWKKSATVSYNIFKARPRGRGIEKRLKTMGINFVDVN